MNWNTLLFVIFPYIAVMVAIIGTVYRTTRQPFSVSSLSSQLFERKKLYWGNISFHYGVLIVLIGHLVALFLPGTLRLWNAAPIRLYLLELTGLGLGLWALAGGLILLWRRLSERRLQVVTTPMDWIVLLAVLLSLVTGVITSSSYRFGSTWFTGVFTPYLLSLFVLRPRPELVGGLPWIIQLHAFNFFVLLFLFPFTRLVHIITLPLGYLIRPWQVVIWLRRPRSPQA